MREISSAHLYPQTSIKIHIIVWNESHNGCSMEASTPFGGHHRTMKAIRLLHHSDVGKMRRCRREVGSSLGDLTSRRAPQLQAARRARVQARVPARRCPALARLQAAATGQRGIASLRPRLAQVANAARVGRDAALAGGERGHNVPARAAVRGAQQAQGHLRARLEAAAALLHWRPAVPCAEGRPIRRRGRSSIIIGSSIIGGIGRSGGLY